MLRERQISLTAKLVKATSRLPGGQPLLGALQRSPLTCRFYRSAVGYRRPFATLAEARAAVAAFAVQGHEHPSNVPHHMELSAAARPSDYAALFHLQPLASTLHTVFDHGGNAGNLYYCYARYLPLPADLSWTVLDLPANMAAGAAIARERKETHLRFSGQWTDAGGVDLLISSGSQHYFETSLGQMVNELPAKPRHILINRTPLTEGPEFAAVQVASGFRLPCLLRNRTELLRGLTDLGYRVIDEWQAPELSVDLPGYPEQSVPHYSGAFLSL